MFSTDLIFRQQEDFVMKQKKISWIKATMQQNSNKYVLLFLPVASSGIVVVFKFCVILLKLAVISAVKEAYKDW